MKKLTKKNKIYDHKVFLMEISINGRLMSRASTRSMNFAVIKQRYVTSAILAFFLLDMKPPIPYA